MSTVFIPGLAGEQEGTDRTQQTGDTCSLKCNEFKNSLFNHVLATTVA